METASSMRQYGVITANYWAFTLTDGALRMLVLLYFYQLGFSPLSLALLFVLYEVFGVVTNLLGGWLGARIGLNRTMQLGLLLQVVALLLLTVPLAWLTVPWVMGAQALSGIAKDLNKMSAKSGVKLLLPAAASGQLYRWVARLTGSKNALKGVGFFLGAALLQGLGFQGAVLSMASALLLIWLLSLLLLRQDLGRASSKPKFRDLRSQSAAINRLSAARLCLFGARDVWFVVALPVFLSDQLGWDFWQVGGFLACWIIGYGLVQALAPRYTQTAQTDPGLSASRWAWLLTGETALMGLLLWYGQVPAGPLLIIGLLLFGGLFAINSSLHSYLILFYARRDGVSLDVGFYYMSNALGRLLGTLLSGLVFQWGGLLPCLAVSAGMLGMAAWIAAGLPAQADHEPARV